MQFPGPCHLPCGQSDPSNQQPFPSATLPGYSGPDTYGGPFPRSKSTGASLPLAQPALQPRPRPSRISHRLQAAGPFVCCVRGAVPPLSSLESASAGHCTLGCTCFSPPDPVTGTLSSKVLWKAHGYDYACMVIDQLQWPKGALTGDTLSSNSPINSLKKERPLGIVEKMMAQNSSILILRSCDLMQASLSSSGKWEIS